MILDVVKEFKVALASSLTSAKLSSLLTTYAADLSVDTLTNFQQIHVNEEPHELLFPFISIIVPGGSKGILFTSKERLHQITVYWALEAWDETDLDYKNFIYGHAIEQCLDDRFVALSGSNATAVNRIEYDQTMYGRSRGDQGAWIAGGEHDLTVYEEVSLIGA